MSRIESEGGDANEPEEEALQRERQELLHRVENWLETPMLVLAFVWLGLLVVELVWGTNLVFTIAGFVIWGIFVVDFGIQFALAPRKRAYLRRNWLLVISLLVPALRVFRIFRLFRLLRVARVGRGVRLFRVVTSLNRGMGALGASLQRRGFVYVVALTVLVAFGGAAGMYAFENKVPGGLDSYGEALWWTAMIMTTLGSQYWPMTLEGRVLCVLLALYAFGVFGYVTATLATFFVGRDADAADSELVGAREINELRLEVIALRKDIGALRPDERPENGE